MLGLLDSLIANIEPEMPGQIARWGGNMAEWQANVQDLRDFISDRCIEITTGLQDCYDVTGPYDVVFNVDPPLTGRIQINSLTPATYPFSGVYYGGIATTLAPIPEPGQSFSYWEVFSSNSILPTTTDSLVTIDILAADSIVAHFQPPIRHDIVLDVFPPGAASINFHGTTYSDLPTTVSLPENAEAIFYAIPALYYDFQHWTVASNAYLPDDSTMIALQTFFVMPDTIVAHLVPQEYAFYVPNSFTPNADGINDMFQPMGRVIDLESYDLQIFDRWGESIYASKDPTEGWDGSIGGRTVPEGVYVYRAYAIDAIKKDVYEIFGHVTLFR